ncbi:hypothetical protein [Streptomyces sp. B1I3]|uniref:hypothetical protein n=1 Tax=Streptomyces sp. B1I3 TaxID=3042264 RepID=UPI002784558D|nr:hypothetical protein [Streptomyces sp. B1I3]MDQ0794001.1 hypothetical protein [Streptomyces sp. B1I3]
MTMPPQGPNGPPRPPQNPYAQQPQGNPYPQQQPPAYGYPQQQPPAYGYPQQQPPAYGYPQQQLPAYGYPQQPPAYGYPPQPPQGAPGPYGQPGMPGAPGWSPQPPRRKRTGLVIGIVAGALVAVAALGFGAYKLVGAGADAAFPEATHKLLVPEKVLDEEFALTQDASDTEGKEIEDTPDPGIRDGQATVAQYTSDDGDVLVLSGMYGRIADPSFMRGKIMEGAAEAEGAKVVVPAEEFRPEGYDVTVECQVVQSTGVGGTSNMPMCAWGDDNTAAMIAVVRLDEATKDASSIDLAKAAEETAEVREEIRKPLS